MKIIIEKKKAEAIRQFEKANEFVKDFFSGRTERNHHRFYIPAPNSN